MSVLTAGAQMLCEQDHRDNEVLSNGAADFYRRIVVRDHRLIGYLALGPRKPGGLAIKRLIDEELDIREITRQLLTEDFDVRTFLTRRRLAVLQAGGMERRAAPGRRSSSRRLQVAFG